VLSQQQRIRHHAEASDAFRFFDQLTSPELFDVLEASLPEHRERLFPPTETLAMFMAQAMKPDRSCQSIVNDAAVMRVRHGFPRCSTKTGAYCKARQRMPLNRVSEMVTYTGQLIAATPGPLALARTACSARGWHDRHPARYGQPLNGLNSNLTSSHHGLSHDFPDNCQAPVAPHGGSRHPRNEPRLHTA